MIMIFNAISTFPLQIVAEDETTGIDIADMEVGKLYAAKFDYTYDDFIPYKAVDGENGESLLEWKGFNDGVAEDDAYVNKADFPQDLIVKRMSEDDLHYLYVANEDWPADYNEYRYVDVYDLIVTGEYVVPPDDDGLIYGEVGLVIDGEVVDSLAIAEGEKTYVFTNLSDKISGTPTYRWQLLIDPENNRWADILHYVYPYAAISEALIANAGIEDRTATLRCIVTQDDLQYASGELNITVNPSLPAPEIPDIPVSTYSLRSASPEQEDATSVMALSNDNSRAKDAFHIVVNYVYWNASPLAKDLHGSKAYEIFTVTLLPGIAYNGVKNHPVVPGYKAYVRDDTADEASSRSYAALEDPEDPTSMKTHRYVAATPIVFSEQKEDKEIIVYYLPEEVSITVNHHFQNLDDDNYSLETTEFLKGLSDYAISDKSVYRVDDANKTPLDNLYLPESQSTGFTGLYYDKETCISASGDTIIDIYYDRNYYLINFDLKLLDGNEAYGVMPLYVRYNTTLALPNPTAPGYSFTGWELISVYNSVEDPDTLEIDKTEVEDQDIRLTYVNTAMLTIRHNLVYKSTWEVALTSYTVIYWLENADNNEFTQRGFKIVENVYSGSIANAGDHPLDLDGNEEDHFVFLEGASDSQVEVKGDGTTAVNAYYARKYYSLTFADTKSSCILGGNYNHTHDGTSCDRALLCTKEEHVHGPECGEKTFVCTIVEEHPSHTEGCCTISEHPAHDKACYANVGDRYTGEKPTRYPVSGTVYRTRYWSYGGYRYNYYIYINDTWYIYESEISDDSQQMNPDCGLEIHVHNTGNCVCPIPLHTHGESCYKYENCDNIGHIHTDSCYGQCKLLEHNCATDDKFYFSGKPSNSSKSNCNIVKVITAKYGADISQHWPIVSGSTTYDVRWAPDNTNSLYKEVLVYIPFMPSESIGFVTNEATHNPFTLRYNLQSLGTSGTEVDGIYYELKNEIKAKYSYLTYEEDFVSLVGFKREFSDPEFENGKIQPSGDRTVNFYYTRIIYNLQFMSNGQPLTNLTQKLMYQEPIGSQYKPTNVPYPTNKEKDAVTFDGWYTTELCTSGTEFTFDGSTIMPVGGLTLYAKWKPTYWDISIYQEDPSENQDAKKLAEYTDLLFGTIPTAAREPKRTPPTAGYIFAGWYYKDDNGDEARFDFNTMPIKDNYTIYAKWTSEIPVPYVVYYRTTIGDKIVNIADPTVGVALAGKPRFFTAKVENDVYEDYKYGYFPIYREMTVNIEPVESDDGEVKPFEIIFEYEHDTHVPYHIKHVFVSDEFSSTAIGGDTLELTWDADASNADSALLTVSFRDLVTEPIISAKLNEKYPTYTNSQIQAIWDVIKNLSPDAYTKRLILETNNPHKDDEIEDDEIEDNVIEFHWSSRYDMVVYEVHYLYENLNYTDDTDRYVTGPINSFEYHFSEGIKVPFKTPITKGFKYVGFYTSTGISGDADAEKKAPLVKPETDSSGNWTNGLIIYAKYDREEYNYNVKFYDKKDNTPIPDVTEDSYSGRFEQIIKIDDVDKDIAGYELANRDAEVELSNDGQAIICYYTKKSATFEYKITLGEAGALSINDEDVFFGNSPEGCYPILVPGYILQDWCYKDSNGDLVPVTDDMATVEDGKIIPRAVTAEDVGKTFMFYAKVSPNTLILQSRITSTTPAINELARGQSFIYKIKGIEDTDTAGYSMTVAIPEGEERTILGLPEGKYIIEVESDWAWRYGEQSQELDFDGEETVTFIHEFPANDPGKNSGYYITGESFN